MLASNGQKSKRTYTQCVCVEYQRSGNGSASQDAHYYSAPPLEISSKYGLFLHGCYFWIKQKRRTIECVAFKLKRLIVFGRQIILCRLPLRRARKRRLVLHFEIGSLGKSSKRNRRSCKRFLPISCFSFRPSCA